MVKNMNSELAVIPSGLTKEVQPLDISIIRSFKAKLRLLWENWRVEGEHSYTNTGRLHRASYATVCQWILDAWSKVTATTIIQGFAKADIVPGLTSNGINSTKTDDSDSEDTGDMSSGLLDGPIAQLLVSDTEDKEFEGFMEDEATDEAAVLCGCAAGRARMDERGGRVGADERGGRVRADEQVAVFTRMSGVAVLAQMSGSTRSLATLLPARKFGACQ
ncbi:hypothetical protein TURU_169699 [Turdus rufiventris]|nr:hypothetical protein TURU_169699 [Turdus rufiventris]